MKTEEDHIAAAVKLHGAARGAAAKPLEVHHPRAVEIDIGVIDPTPTVLPDQPPKKRNT